MTDLEKRLTQALAYCLPFAANAVDAIDDALAAHGGTSASMSGEDDIRSENRKALDSAIAVVNESRFLMHSPID